MVHVPDHEVTLPPAAHTAHPGGEPTRNGETEEIARTGSALPAQDVAEEAEDLADDARGAGDPLEAELPEGRFADRELSWLAFNRRVLVQAQDRSQALLERAWFLSIFASVLDEFFMVRVAGRKRRIATGLAVPAASGLTPRQVLEAISVGAHELMEEHARTFAEDIQPALAAEGDRKSTRLNSSHVKISYAVFCLKTKKHGPSRQQP